MGELYTDFLIVMQVLGVRLTSNRLQGAMLSGLLALALTMARAVLSG